ncbi:MAG: DNA polymerase I [Tractidigestivibacter sp.]|jgi:DNA polymerase-1|uniref:DNA polymerase I n=1 Tax=Tractidigestivibacter sp. TaxID=2847320 RepID=UPI003D8C4740
MPETNQQDRRTIAVIDGNSLMHRAYHAIMQPMTAPDGRSTNALFGFFNMFIKMVETFHPNGIICAFDKGKPQVRIDMLPQYKAQRPPMDDALHEQFPMVKDLLRTLDVPVCELEGWEGDDILGTLARRGESEGYEMLLFTGDRDMYQLATDHVKIVSTKKGVSEVSIMTPESVDDLYHGVTPDLVPDFYGLKGDSSDNIPGVPGIGPKKAAALIVQYGSLDNVIAHADEVKGKMGENLRAHIDDALLSRKVATIRTDAPIDIDLADAKFPTFDPAEVKKAFSDLGFTGMTKRILKLSDAPMPADEPAPASVDVSLGDVLSGEKAYSQLESAVASGEWVGVALDEPGHGEQLSLDFEDEPKAGLWVSCEKYMAHIDGDRSHEALALLFKKGRVAAGDVKALLHELIPYDSSEPAEISPAKVGPDRIFDVGVADYLLDSDRNDFSPAALAKDLLPSPLPEATGDVPQAAIDALASRLLVPALQERMAKTGEKTVELFSKLEMPLLPVLLVMERRGLHADRAILRAQSDELGAEIDQMVAHIHEQAGEDFNIDSPMQLSHVLFDVWKLPTTGLKRTKRGYYSTNAKTLSDLADKDGRVAEVLEYRERAKIKSTYLDALPQLIRGDGRIHTTFNQTVAATGRLSSSDPNLQNIPTRSELGHRVRKAFTAPEGTVFLACDYSQIELRLLAHLSGDEHLIAAFCEGRDFHAATAARVFDVPIEEVTPQMRSRAKAVNFGIVYGQQAYGLATSLKIPRSEAQQMIDRYFEAYPDVERFLKGLVEFAHKNGYVETMYGRRRYTADISSKNFQLRSFAERTAMNHPMQGSAADIIKIAMVRVERELAEKNLKSRLVLQIHDELDLEVPEGEIEEASELVKQTMEGVVKLRVPLIAEVSYGYTWADAK